MRLQIDEELRNVGQNVEWEKPVEWEGQVFDRSRTREEYVKLVSTLIWKLRNYNKKVHTTGGDVRQKILEVVIVRTNKSLAYAFSEKDLTVYVLFHSLVNQST